MNTLHVVPQPIWALVPSEVRPGDIILTADDQITSKAIRGITFSDFSHVIVHVDEGLLMEAVGDGVIIRRARGFYVTDRGYVRVMRSATPLTSAQVSAIRQSIENRLGKAYSKRGAVRTVLPLISYDPQRATFCSRLVLEGFRENAIDVVPGVELNEVQPKHFASSPVLKDITEQAVRRLDPKSDKDEYDTVLSFSGVTTETLAGLLGRRLVDMIRRELPESSRTQLHSFLDLLNWLSAEAENGRAESLQTLDGPLSEALTESGYIAFLAGDLPTQEEFLRFLKWAADSAEAFAIEELDPPVKALGDWLFQEQLNAKATRELNQRTSEGIKALASATRLKSLDRLASVYSKRQSLADQQNQLVERLSRALRR
jgi:hypothetical protein